jgi:hypothetical protein
MPRPPRKRAAPARPSRASGVQRAALRRAPAACSEDSDNGRLMAYQPVVAVANANADLAEVLKARIEATRNDDPVN